jgi:hypothetical protein
LRSVARQKVLRTSRASLVPNALQVLSRQLPADFLERLLYQLMRLAMPLHLSLKLLHSPLQALNSLLIILRH